MFGFHGGYGMVIWWTGPETTEETNRSMAVLRDSKVWSSRARQRPIAGLLTLAAMMSKGSCVFVHSSNVERNQ